MGSLAFGQELEESTAPVLRCCLQLEEFLTQGTTLLAVREVFKDR